MNWFYAIMESSDKNGGVRRYQNKDGSLTKAGIRRRDKFAKKLGKVNSDINFWKYAAATTENPFDAYRYEWNYQLESERIFDAVLKRMEKELGSQNIGKIEDNPVYKKYAKRGEKYYNKLVEYNKTKSDKGFQTVSGGILLDPSMIFGPDWDKDK